MLSSEQAEVQTHLATAHQKLMEIIAQGEADNISLQTICQITSMQSDLQSAATSLLMCQMRTSLEALIKPGHPDDVQKQLIEQYQIWLTFRS